VHLNTYTWEKPMSLNKATSQHRGNIIALVAWTAVTGVAVLAISIFGSDTNNPLLKALYEASTPTLALTWVVTAVAIWVLHLGVRLLGKADKHIGTIFQDELGSPE
jgi:hypothetical protein